MPSKGSDLLIFDNFYKLLTNEEFKKFESGQLCWAPIIYPSNPPQILELSKDSIPPDESEIEFRIANFYWDLRNHIPLKSIGLQQDEYFFVNKGKIRPCIVLGNIKTTWYKRLEQHIILCIPLFRFKDIHTQNFVIKIQALAIPHLFYLPQKINGCYEECCARFEFSQAIFKEWLRPFRAGSDSKPAALSDETHALIINHFFQFVFKKPWIEELDEEIKTYKEILFEAYNIKM